MNKKRPSLYMIPLLAVGLGASVALYFYASIAVSISCAALTLLTYTLATVLIVSYKKTVNAALDDVFTQNRTAAAEIVLSISVPALLFDSGGRVIWGNDAFKTIFDGRDVKRLLPALDPANPPAAQTAEYGGKHYQIMTMPVERNHEAAKKLYFSYWLDRTEAIHYARLYEEQMPTVALIYVDNYDELSADKQFHRNTVLSEVEKRVSQFVASIEGAYRRYDNTRFIVIFEAKFLAELERTRFTLLDTVRDIDTGTGQQVTLSIAVGAANRIALSDEGSRQAMELALGRGGDQAVVKRGAKYDFYGGKLHVVSKQSRVKARLFAKALRQLMENSDQIFIMGHRHPDMDCLGATMGLMRCAAVAGCRSYMVTKDDDSAIADAMHAIKDNRQYRDMTRTPEQAIQLMSKASVVIVVDTQREGSLISPELYAKAPKTVIIDHHRRSVDSLSGSTLNYLEAGASSASEMMTEVVQYFDESMRLTSIECGALLGGIILDTKHFEFNTGARTFDAAGYLRRNGADMGAVKLMFQDDMNAFRQRAEVVQRANISERGIAVSHVLFGTDNPLIIAAQAADELITIKGIEASFVLAVGDDSIINISGRSLGDINVQLILERMGGGGHLTVAGAQVHDMTLEQAEVQLNECIDDYFTEVK